MAVIPSSQFSVCLFCRYLGFVGCIKGFDIADASDSLFDLSKPNMTGSNEARGSCYDTAQPGLGFNGSVWARFGTRSFTYQLAIANLPCRHTTI